MRCAVCPASDYLPSVVKPMGKALQPVECWDTHLSCVGNHPHTFIAVDQQVLLFLGLTAGWRLCHGSHRSTRGHHVLYPPWSPLAHVLGEQGCRFPNFPSITSPEDLSLVPWAENMPSETDLAWRELNVSKFHGKCQWQSGRRNQGWVGVLHNTYFWVTLLLCYYDNIPDKQLKG